MNASPLLLKAVRESRMEISQEYRSLCSELDLQKKIKHSFRQHPFLWLGGAVGAGLLTTFLGAKRRIVSSTIASPATLGAMGVAGALSKVGWLAGAVEIGKFAWPLLRPVVLEFANKAVQGTLAKKGKTP